MIKISPKEEKYVSFKVKGNEVVDESSILEWRHAMKYNCSNNDVCMFVVLLDSINKTVKEP